MPQKAEYMAIDAPNATALNTQLNQLSGQNWKPILFTTSSTGSMTILHVILEHVMGT